MTENGKVVGYTIKFAKSNPIVIYNGKDGANGVDGNTPVIGVKKDTDGIYYWTLNGEFIVADGQKIKAQGTDGSDGADGSDGNDGQDGTNGKDGVTPKLEIRDGYWFVSYDNGSNWTQLGKATGEDGTDGKDADSIKNHAGREQCLFRIGRRNRNHHFKNWRPKFQYHHILQTKKRKKSDVSGCGI
ncbi:MAG: DUF4988 domain-containing protein [Alistipes putredinis]|nr:MAG: DUF4988 domain-containing protein [Alistipes putredinis]